MLWFSHNGRLPYLKAIALSFFLPKIPIVVSVQSATIQKLSALPGLTANTGEIFWRSSICSVIGGTPSAH
jgi:hypothetical protein